jgi:dihydroorotase
LLNAKPAKILGLKTGSLSIGSQADICIFNPDTRWTVQASALLSQGKHTPFLGYELQGQVHTTLVAGRIVFQR